MFHDVMAVSELPLDSQRCVNIEGQRILLCHTETGIYAIENNCSHVQMPLEGGKIIDDVIRCPAHGARFDITTGKPVIARTLSAVKTYPVKTVEERVLVDI